MRKSCQKIAILTSSILLSSSVILCAATAEADVAVSNNATINNTGTNANTNTNAQLSQQAQQTKEIQQTKPEQTTKPEQKPKQQNSSSITSPIFAAQNVLVTTPTQNNNDLPTHEKGTSALVFNFDYAEDPGYAHITPSAISSVNNTTVKNLWNSLQITVSKSEDTDKDKNKNSNKDKNKTISKTYTVNNTEVSQYVDSNGQVIKKNDSVYHFGGYWKDGDVLTVKVDPTALTKAGYHLSKDVYEKGDVEAKTYINGEGYNVFKITYKNSTKNANGNAKAMIVRIPLGKLNVIFDSQGGSINGKTENISNTVKGDNTVEFPKDPTKNGLHFNGWYTQFPTTLNGKVFPNNLGGKIWYWSNKNKLSDYSNDSPWILYNDSGIDKPGDQKFLLRAQWVAKVTFNAENGSKTEEKYFLEGSKLFALPANPTKANYTFKEWNTKSDGTGKSINSAVAANLQLNNDLTLYAIYTPVASKDNPPKNNTNPIQNPNSENPTSPNDHINKPNPSKQQNQDDSPLQYTPFDINDNNAGISYLSVIPQVTHKLNENIEKFSNDKGEITAQMSNRTTISTGVQQKHNEFNHVQTCNIKSGLANTGFDLRTAWYAALLTIAGVTATTIKTVALKSTSKRKH